MEKEDKNRLITEWVNLYSDNLFTWAYHKTSSKEIAEDIVQDTFVSAHQAIDRFNHQSQAKTWLFSILNNKIIDHYRKSARQINTISDEEKASINQTNSLFNENGGWVANANSLNWETEENILDNSEFKKTMEHCIAKLPDKWKVAVVGKYTLEKKSEEICKELKITSSNYWQILHRAKLQLKACIEKNWIR